MTLDRDPERSERVLDRLDARHYGDDLDDDDRPVPDDVAPLCDSCGEREAVDSFPLGDEEVPLCGRCAVEDVDVDDARD